MRQLPANARPHIQTRRTNLHLPPTATTTVQLSDTFETLEVLRLSESEFIGSFLLPREPRISPSKSPNMAEAAHKPDKDFTKEVDEQIPQAELLAKVCFHSETRDIDDSN